MFDKTCFEKAGLSAFDVECSRFLVCLRISPVLHTCSDSFFCKHNKIIANSAVFIFLYRSNLISARERERETERQRDRERDRDRETDREHFYKDFRLDCPVAFISNSKNGLYSLCLPNNLPGIFDFTFQYHNYSDQRSSLL